MDLTFLGAGAVKLSGRKHNVICDPVAASGKADVVTWSTTQGLSVVPGAMVLDSPGEYEVGGSMITGVAARLHVDESGENATMFSIMIDGVNVVVTGNIAGDLSPAQLEALGKVDVLVIPVGGHGLTLDAAGAAAVVAKFEPAYVVPVHYDDGVGQYEMPQDAVDLFLKEMGVNPEPVAKLKINPKEMPTETQVVVLTPAT